jgi:ssDNA-binding Zn-finger/Zn-ribbon topoisomerase 1
MPKAQKPLDAEAPCPKCGKEWHELTTFSMGHDAFHGCTDCGISWELTKRPVLSGMPERPDAPPVDPATIAARTVSATDASD